MGERRGASPRAGIPRSPAPEPRKAALQAEARRPPRSPTGAGPSPRNDPSPREDSEGNLTPKHKRANPWSAGDGEAGEEGPGSARKMERVMVTVRLRPPLPDE